MKNILIIHYNTPELTTALIQSINKNSPGFLINVFDNSNQYPLPKIKNVNIFDNTNKLYCDFNLWLNSFKTSPIPNNNNVFGSSKHMKSVLIGFDLLPEGFILLDSDTLVKLPLDDLWNENYIFVSDISENILSNIPIKRVIPFVSYINVPMCKEHNILFYNTEYNWMTSDKVPNKFYDTGAWFLLACKEKEMPFKLINHNDYILHYRAGSRLYDKQDLQRLLAWLNKNKNIYE